MTLNTEEGTKSNVCGVGKESRDVQLRANKQRERQIKRDREKEHQNTCIRNQEKRDNHKNKYIYSS